MPYINPEITVRALLEARAVEHSRRTFCIFKNRKIDYATLDRSVNKIANSLITAGIEKGSRVAVMMGQHPDHIFLFFALAKIGAIMLPINVHLKGVSLEFLLDHGEPAAIIADAKFSNQLLYTSRLEHIPLVFWRGKGAEVDSSGTRSFESLLAYECGSPPLVSAKADDVLAICYTSGTTGEPKGVFLTDKMYRTAATSSLFISGIQEGDIPFFWEPIYHLFGMEVLVLAVMTPLTLAMVERFTASRFWSQVRDHQATHIHFVGGVLQLLLKQNPSEEDRSHRVRVAWGGGCPKEIWQEFEQRFGLSIRESFGMTETAALNIANIESETGSVGKILPYFEACIVDENGEEVGENKIGELLIREKEPGLITTGYFKNPEATAKAFRGDWLHTGDLLKRDERNFFYYIGRKKDSVRRRGENISAWEVERVINTHSDVEESALIGVSNEFGDEDIKIYIKPVSGCKPDPLDIIRWCETRMARFQIPRFFAFVSKFDKTPTQRIKKEHLSRSIKGCWDRDKLTAD